MNRMKLKTDDLPERPFKRMKQEEESGANMDDLPSLAFEKILSYLGLEDRTRARAVSRKWCKTIDRFRVKSLCFSENPRGSVYGGSRLARGVFAQNFIRSRKFEPFLNTFAKSILSSLKHLRLCDFDLHENNKTAFAQTLNSFSQLEELDLIRFNDEDTYVQIGLVLNLPMLNNVQFDSVYGIRKLTLDTPRLQKIKIWKCDFYLTQHLNIVHAESVERLTIDRIGRIKVKKLKNLKSLYTARSDIELDSTFFSSLKQLKEIHLAKDSADDVSEIFDQKEQHNRADLKIYLCGLALNGPQDPAIDSLYYLDEGCLRCLAENPSRLADEIPFCKSLRYEAIESVSSRSEMSFLGRFTGLEKIEVDEPVQDIERFSKNLGNIAELWLDFQHDQPQDLFDRLPEHCAVQWLEIQNAPTDLGFLSRLKNLIYLDLDWSIDAKTVRKVLEELEFLSYFRFMANDDRVTVEIIRPKQFWISFDDLSICMSDVEAAIECIFGEEDDEEDEEDEK